MLQQDAPSWGTLASLPWKYSTRKGSAPSLAPQPYFDAFGDDPVQCSGVLPVGLALTLLGSLGHTLASTGHSKWE